jgi:hypothetical protein
MLSSHEILKLAFSAGPGARGHVEAMRRKARGSFAPHGGRTELSTELRRLFSEVSENRGSARESYRHPATAASGSARERTGGAGLGASEIAWLQRIPTDPNQVSFADATELAKLSSTIDRMKYPADGRLIDQAWKPVKEFHDRNAAQVALRNAERPLPSVPSSALGALAAAILAENDQLRPEEALTRADDALVEAHSTRVQQRDLAIGTAQAELMKVDAAEYERTAVTP